MAICGYIENLVIRDYYFSLIFQIAYLRIETYGVRRLKK